MDPNLSFLSLSLSLSRALPKLNEPHSTTLLTAYSLSGAVNSTWRPVTMIFAVLALAGAARATTIGAATSR